MQNFRISTICLLLGFYLAASFAEEVAPPTPPAPIDSTACDEREILMPQIVMETRQVVCEEMRPKLVTKKVPVVKRVPVTKMVTRCTVRLTQKKFPQTVCRQEPAPKDSTTTICVTKMVPKTEKLTGMRKVTRQVPVVEKQIVCEDHGHWEACGCACRCSRCLGGGCCGKCPRKRWVPNPVERVVEVTVMKSQCSEEPYEYEVTRMTPTVEKRELTLREYGHARKITEEREITMLVPECVQETVPTTTCRCYTTFEAKQCTVMVPVKVIKEIQVPVCRMVRMPVDDSPQAPAPAVEEGAEALSSP